MTIEELRQMKNSLAPGEDLRIAIEWPNAMGCITGYLVRVLGVSFTIRTDAGNEAGPFTPDRMIGLPLKVKDML